MQRSVVRAWRAGYVILFLDGFDELAPRGSQGSGRRVKDIRFRALELVRRFVKENPSLAPILIAGRSHYFDSNSELVNALGIDKRWTHLTLSDFTEEQVQSYLSKKGYKSAMPRWLPARPLLVGYLASRDFLEGLLNPDEDQSVAVGWDRLLQYICEREVNQIEPGFSAEDLREVIERLATKARKKTNPIGPLTGKEIIETFKEVRQYEPEEKSFLELLRLPGLCRGNDSALTHEETTPRQVDHFREFIDKDFADAASAGDVVRFFDRPFEFNTLVFSGCRHVLGEVGTSIVAHKCRMRGYSESKLSAALKHLNGKEKGCTVIADILKIMIENGRSYTQDPLRVTNLAIDFLILGSDRVNYSQITLEDCYISHLELRKKRKNEYLPTFISCCIGVVKGVDGREELPSGQFHSTCEFDEFENCSVTFADVSSSELARGSRVLCILLYKLFVQNGLKSRLEGTLFGACDSKEKSLVPKVLGELEREKILRQVRSEGKRWVIPEKRAMDRVRDILDKPDETTDPLVHTCKELY